MLLLSGCFVVGLIPAVLANNGKTGVTAIGVSQSVRRKVKDFMYPPPRGLTADKVSGSCFFYRFIYIVVMLERGVGEMFGLIVYNINAIGWY